MPATRLRKLISAGRIRDFVLSVMTTLHAQGIVLPKIFFLITYSGSLWRQNESRLVAFQRQKEKSFILNVSQLILDGDRHAFGSPSGINRGTFIRMRFFIIGMRQI